MNAEVITVGTEILMGQILNTNSQYIANKLAELGISHYYDTTVGDNWDRLCTAIENALDRSDIVILTGGLGPTSDDITKEAAAHVMKRDLVLDRPSLEKIKNHFSSRGKVMPENNIKQAMLPDGCIILKNEVGTAPGCIIESDNGTAILLPGPPREMNPMFEHGVLPYLGRISDSILYTRVIRIFGMGESAVASMIKDVIDKQTNPTIAPYVKPGEVTLRVTAKCNNIDEGKALAEPVIKEICSIIGEAVYSTDDEGLNEVCSRMLADKQLTLAVAESCTGGMLSSTLVSVPGSSRWFVEGAVTYSNDSKLRRLGVKPDSVAQFGAVSRIVAAQMAEGARLSSGADIGISTTGIAGPCGGSDNKPVGLVYVGIADLDGTYVKELRLNGSREHIRNLATLNALDLLRRRLSDSQV